MKRIELKRKFSSVDGEKKKLKRKKNIVENYYWKRMNKQNKNKEGDISFSMYLLTP